MTECDKVGQQLQGESSMQAQDFVSELEYIQSVTKSHLKQDHLWVHKGIAGGLNSDETNHRTPLVSLERHVPKLVMNLQSVQIECILP